MERDDSKEPVHSIRFCVLTLFPEMIRNAVSYSVLGRAAAAGIISVDAVDIRDYSQDKHKHVDDYPFGGGAGMVMQPQPIYDAYEDVRRGFAKPPKVVYLSPKGRVLSQEIARELAQEEGIILLCGHYEGVDQRVLDEIVTDEISIGDFVLTGGELPALVLIDAVARMVDGVLGNESSAGEESFSGMFLEYPQYTRPREYHGVPVPEILMSGHHANIAEWRLTQSIAVTVQKRPDRIDPERMTEQERRIYEKLRREGGASPVQSAGGDPRG